MRSLRTIPILGRAGWQNVSPAEKPPKSDTRWAGDLFAENAVLLGLAGWKRDVASYVSTVMYRAFSIQP